MGEARPSSPLVGEAESRSDRVGGVGANVSDAGANTPASVALRATRPSPQGGGEGAGDWLHLAGSIDGDTHILPVRVYYEDTDFSGVVYHANYLRFMERGRTDFLRLAGVSQSTLHAGGEGLILAVRRMTLDFQKPARMDDVLTIETHAAEVRGASFILKQRILRGAEVILTADVHVAAIAGGRPARIPDDLRAILERGR
jgi:acyl-CoA thioester hydrolase